MTDTPPSSPYERYRALYDADQPPPWDSGIVPPEVRALVEGDDPLPPGRALDVGCGTGTSSIYLASHGWQATGVDWIEAAVVRAREKAAQAGLTSPPNPLSTTWRGGTEALSPPLHFMERGQGGEVPQVQFLRASAISPDFLPDHLPVSLWLDIGCVHGFSPEARAVYAGHAARLVEPGGRLLIYAWGRHERDGHAAGFDREDIYAVFGATFDLLDAVMGAEATNNTIPAGWYTLRRK